MYWELLELSTLDARRIFVQADAIVARIAALFRQANCVRGRGQSCYTAEHGGIHFLGERKSRRRKRGSTLCARLPRSHRTAG
jgi:hypothetical protein